MNITLMLMPIGTFGIWMQLKNSSRQNHDEIFKCRHKTDSHNYYLPTITRNIGCALIPGYFFRESSVQNAIFPFDAVITVIKTRG